MSFLKDETDKPLVKRNRFQVFFVLILHFYICQVSLGTSDSPMVVDRQMKFIFLILPVITIDVQ